MSISYAAQLPFDVAAYGKPNVAILNGITDPSPGSLGLVAGDQLTLQLYPRAKTSGIGSATTSVQMDSGFSIIVTGKPLATPDANTVLFIASSFTESQDANGNWVYSAVLDMDTDELAAAFANNQLTLQVMLVIEITTGANGPKRYLMPITAYNETYSGTEGAPTRATPGYLNQTASDARYAQLANNLSDLPSASVARTSLGLGTASTHAATDFDAAGSASAAQSAAETASIPATAFDQDGTMAANSNARVPSQAAVRAYVAANAGITAPMNFLYRNDDFTAEEGFAYDAIGIHDYGAGVATITLPPTPSDDAAIWISGFGDTSTGSQWVASPVTFDGGGNQIGTNSGNPIYTYSGTANLLLLKWDGYNTAWRIWKFTVINVA
jgi:hypothetical protein